MVVNESRLNQLLKNVNRSSINCPKNEESNETIDCPDTVCSECWKDFITEPPLIVETPVMIQLVSEQLKVDPELLK